VGEVLGLHHQLVWVGLVCSLILLSGVGPGVLTIITVAAIATTDIKDQPELLAEYAAECGVAALGPISPQWEMYERMQAAGLLQMFGVYVDGGMVGFANVLVSVLPHYGFIASTVESLFVAQAHRNSGAGARLMKTIERHARDRECKAVFYGAPAGGKMEGLLGKRYARASSMYYKPLG
jgi:GNAT superfamily N-acetyltransferase